MPPLARTSRRPPTRKLAPLYVDQVADVRVAGRATRELDGRRLADLELPAFPVRVAPGHPLAVRTPHERVDAGLELAQVQIGVVQIDDAEGHHRATP